MISMRINQYMVLIVAMLLTSLASAQDSILDSGMSSKEIAERILRDANKRYREEKANKQILVTMYSTSWCGYCRKARRYFNARNIKFKEHGIEKSRWARAQYNKLGGSGVPLIVVGGSIMRGFSVDTFESLYK